MATDSIDVARSAYSIGPWLRFRPFRANISGDDSPADVPSCFFQGGFLGDFDVNNVVYAAFLHPLGGNHSGPQDLQIPFSTHPSNDRADLIAADVNSGVERFLTQINTILSSWLGLSGPFSGAPLPAFGRCGFVDYRPLPPKMA